MNPQTNGGGLNRQPRAIKPPRMPNRGNNPGDLVELNEYGGVGDEKPLQTDGKPLFNENFIDKIKAKLDLLDQM